MENKQIQTQADCNIEAGPRTHRRFRISIETAVDLDEVELMGVIGDTPLIEVVERRWAATDTECADALAEHAWELGEFNRNVDVVEIDDNGWTAEDFQEEQRKRDMKERRSAAGRKAWASRQNGPK
jgi:hypothetical protein